MRPLVFLALLGIVAPALAQVPRPRRPAPAPKQPLARRLLRRMVQAELSMPFIAREVLVSSSGSTEEQWVRQDPRRGVRRETIQPVGNLIVDTRARQFRIFAKEQRFEESRSHFAESQKRLQEVLRLAGEGLSIELQGQDTIAGRPADVVLVHPTAQEGPSRRFWIDRESGLRLRMEERDAAGRILSNAYYLSLDLSPTFRDEDFVPPPVPAGFRKIAENLKRFSSVEEAARQGVTLKLPGWLPSGFTLRTITAAHKGKGPVTVQWGNDLTALTLVSTQAPPPMLFLRQLSGAEAGFVKLQRGDRAYVRKQAEGYFLLIGSLPDDQLKRIADSVK